MTEDKIEREVVIVTPVGERMTLATTAIPLRDEAGTLVGVTVLISPASAPLSQRS